MAEVKRLYGAGLDLHEIAHQLGIGQTTVTNYITEMGIADRRGRKGRSVTNRLSAISRLVHQLDQQADILAGLVDDVNHLDIPVPQETLANWDAVINRRDNITAVIQRLRRIINERSTSDGDIAQPAEG